MSVRAGPGGLRMSSRNIRVPAYLQDEYSAVNQLQSRNRPLRDPPGLEPAPVIAVAPVASVARSQSVASSSSSSSSSSAASSPSEVIRAGQVYKRVETPISLASRRRLLATGSARISHPSKLKNGGIDTVFYVSSRDYGKLMRKLAKGKGSNIKLTANSIKVNMMHGSGIFDDIKSYAKQGYSKVKDLAGQYALPYAREQGLALARSGIDKGLNYLQSKVKSKIGGNLILCQFLI